MGDPSLRNSYILAPTNLNIVAGGVTNALSWSGVPLVDGYNIYRRYSTSTDFIKLNTSLVTATTYTDNTMPTGGTVYYYVKSVKKKISPSGSFDNESLGIKSSAALVTVGVTENDSDLSFAISPNPSNGIFNIVTTQAFYNYDICDNLGRIFFTGTSSQFDINSYANGIYYVKIKLKNEVVIKKIIKNN
jgi:fibronectin type 3 domain-containing protein